MCILEVHPEIKEFVTIIKLFPGPGTHQCAVDTLQSIDAVWMFPGVWVGLTPELHVMKGMFVNWRLLCKDRKAWTNAIHKVVEMHT